MLLRGPHWAWHSFEYQDADRGIALVSATGVFTLLPGLPPTRAREKCEAHAPASACRHGRLPQRVDAFACCAVDRVFLPRCGVGLKTRCEVWAPGGLRLACGCQGSCVWSLFFLSGEITVNVVAEHEERRFLQRPCGSIVTPGSWRRIDLPAVVPAG